MIRTRNIYGNDKHCILYFGGDETIVNNGGRWLRGSASTSGQFSSTSTSLSDITQLSFNIINYDGVNKYTWLSNLAGSTIVITNESHTSQTGTYTVDSIIDLSTTVTLNVTLVSANGNDYNGDIFTLEVLNDNYGHFAELSYLSRDININSVVQTSNNSRFSPKSYLWGTSTSQSVGMSASTTSDYQFRAYDFCIDMWVYFNSGATTWGNLVNILDLSDVDNYINVAVYPHSTQIEWEIQINNGGLTPILNFQKQVNDFNLKTWYFVSLSRKVSLDEFGENLIESYSIHFSRESTNAIYWLTGGTSRTITKYNWSNPVVLIGKNLTTYPGSSSGPSRLVNVTNVYIDNFRISKGNERLYSIDGDNYIKRKYRPNNRAY